MPRSKHNKLIFGTHPVDYMVMLSVKFQVPRYLIGGGN
jgi:hypothetical protein